MDVRALGGKLMAVVLMAAVYVGLALGNEWMLASMEYGKGVNWVYIPAGLRLGFVLVMPWAGALAISLGSFAMALRDPDLTPALAAFNGCVTGIAPVLARHWAVSRWGLSDDLRELNAPLLVKLCVLFGLFSSTFHQAFFAWLGREAGVFAGAIPMFVGDTLGALLCLYLIRTALNLRLRRSS
jgi:hypothetical protein